MHYLFIGFPKNTNTLVSFICPSAEMAGVKLTESEIKAQVDDVRLMTKGELKKIFPRCKIITERFLFIPKSYIVLEKHDE